jgi:hypothetical protein
MIIQAWPTDSCRVRGDIIIVDAHVRAYKKGFLTGSLFLLVPPDCSRFGYVPGFEVPMFFISGAGRRHSVESLRIRHTHRYIAMI